jgi:adenosylcobinamide kinase / adenosylcobinamide-phosphate guanylyltransferase
MSVELILGGARSGKSRYALMQATALDTDQHAIAWCATAQAYDDEMQLRIAHHQAERPNHWQTIEAPLYLSAALTSPSTSVLVVDCLTLWLSNWLCREDAGLDAPDWHAEHQRFMTAIHQLTTQPDQHVFLVSNEVGFGIVPDNALARRFRDEAGRLHQQIAQCVDHVTLVVAGIAMPVKRPVF